jgi:hypothetical protein
MPDWSVLLLAAIGAWIILSVILGLVFGQVLSRLPDAPPLA